ncbi:hypothetical protein ASPSYDRAFT_467707 [Aspergillus sydowii CBS 593.65]|uniref:Secreted protein n=1 Tax=Aspergillus sydowii CBS 593.65 TaxID=1036612 RepID=A0A1L9T506_9EURO|nr:uncharacterized protein ASPSYDRAFT_467707 [Aspergillus sydowii CBS 593.65]OJJ54530.1 hypothetical protein ASPSYDRAFT_467707 [Aspergillus sydowii CBS 593.65]
MGFLDGALAIAVVVLRCGDASATPADPSQHQHCRRAKSLRSLKITENRLYRLLRVALPCPYGRRALSSNETKPSLHAIALRSTCNFLAGDWCLGHPSETQWL